MISRRPDLDYAHAIEPIVIYRVANLLIERHRLARPGYKVASVIPNRRHRPSIAWKVRSKLI